MKVSKWWHFLFLRDYSFNSYIKTSGCLCNDCGAQPIAACVCVCVCVCRGKMDGLAAPQVAEAQRREDTGQKDSVSSFVDMKAAHVSLWKRRTQNK